MRARHGLQGLLRGLRRTEVGLGDQGPPPADSELLLRVLCHEFRTPVSTLTSLTRALADERRELTGADRRAITELARDQAAHLQSLLRGAAAGTGALASTAQPEPAVPLAGMLREAAALVPANRRRVRATRWACACPVPSGRTRQVLVNLVENALRHGPAQGQVGLYAALRRPGLSILVTDEGRVDDALLAAMRRTAPVAGMSGLGLWIVRQLLAADGGALRVHRLRPRGVALEVLLPVVRVVR
ncbi:MULTISPECIES: sensor histidine kinase KdpD [unclassified Micromonospora]|uniref:sensor histidine kinase n=1 Tax=unclassified Micromonospora TaxID=2617518 RepID=UPI000EF50D72|nr:MULTISPECIES: HAMP domain-containing sensor histidine kinase [unclassified Micromonospora]RLP85443.1 sensor histidine kinase [Micromonospora sp. BL4]RLP96546.1 sensor histidine kinase [Micromonospora sp. CV4]